MKIELDKTMKIELLKAIQSGAIESDLLQSWQQSATQLMSDAGVINELMSCESRESNAAICDERIRRGLCPIK